MTSINLRIATCGILHHLEYIHGIRANSTDIILHILNTVAPKDPWHLLFGHCQNIDPYVKRLTTCYWSFKDACACSMKKYNQKIWGYFEIHLNRCVYLLINVEIRELLERVSGSEKLGYEPSCLYTGWFVNVPDPWLFRWTKCKMGVGSVNDLLKILVTFCHKTVQLFVIIDTSR